MAFGRAVLVREARSDEDADLLQDALSLLGYDDPATSPCGNLLSVKVPRCFGPRLRWGCGSGHRHKCCLLGLLRVVRCEYPCCPL